MFPSLIKTFRLVVKTFIKDFATSQVKLAAYLLGMFWVGKGQSSFFWGVMVKLLKWSSSFLCDTMLTLYSVSLPFPPLGNDLEALQIHLCFCHSNLHPRTTAGSGSTLVSAVSNIYLSQQTGERPGSCWRLQTGRPSYQLATRSLPAESCFVKRIWDGLDLSALRLPRLLYQPVHKKSPNHILLFQHLLTCFLFCFISQFFLRAVDQCLIFLGLIFHFCSQLIKGFSTFSSAGWYRFIYVHSYVYILYEEGFFPHSEGKLMHFKTWL